MKDLLERVTIRQATLSDTVLISVLASVTFYEAYFEQDESANLASYIHESFAIDAVKEEISDIESLFFLASLDGKAVGYARLIENSRLDCVTGSSVIELKRIYILERLWKAGVGKMLLEHCVGEAKRRGFDILWLGVWEENARAKAFYDRFGFTEAGKVSFPYGNVVGTNLVFQLPLR